MIVERDRKTLSEIYLALLHNDYTLEVTTDAGEMMPRMERFRPDLLLVGYDLPGYEVNEVCTSVKNAFEIPVILLSDPLSVQTLCMQSVKADGVLEKPINTDILLNQLEALLLV